MKKTKLVLILIFILGLLAILSNKAYKLIHKPISRKGFYSIKQKFKKLSNSNMTKGNKSIKLIHIQAEIQAACLMSN